MKPEFDPDEKPAFGQVWSWNGNPPIMLLAPVEPWAGHPQWTAIWLDKPLAIEPWVGLGGLTGPIDGWEQLA